MVKITNKLVRIILIVAFIFLVIGLMYYMYTAGILPGIETAISEKRSFSP